jgi:competence protein ComEC
LAAKVPIGTIYDHGETWDKANIKTAAIVEAYNVVRRKYPHKVLRPGDSVPIKGITVDVVAGSGVVIAKPMAGAGAKNSLCSSYHALDPDPGENALSLGFIIQFGNFRVADLGDLFWNKEYLLACPVNKLGTVDVYMTTHHGTKTSGHPQIVHALKPRVAIMNNGEVKGGSKLAWQTIHDSPGLEDLWQLHFSSEGAKEHNSADQWIANVQAKCAGKGIVVSGKAAGGFTVRNERNGFEKSYPK